MGLVRSVNGFLAILPRVLSRVTSGGRYLPVIDGLRCIAIVAVVMYHLEDYVVHKHPQWDRTDYAATWMHRVLHTGGCGVPLFFAISGFILGLPFIEARQGQRAPVPLSRYYWRRVTRLEPPYLINLAIMCLLLTMVKDFTWDEMWPHLLASAVYVHGLVYGTMSTINFVAWSLEVEVQFYLLAPLLAVMFYRPSRWIRRGLLISTMTVLILAKQFNNGPLVTSWPTALINHLDHFLVGWLLADLFATDWQGDPVQHRKWDFVALIGWAGVLTTQLVYGLNVWLPVATFVAFAGSLRGRWSHRLLSQRPLVLIGGMCYTI
jgi:peptidoglycan/LPS O-acetylase OafA/YrhL